MSNASTEPVSAHGFRGLLKRLPNAISWTLATVAAIIGILGGLKALDLPPFASSSPETTRPSGERAQTGGTSLVEVFSGPSDHRDAYQRNDALPPLQTVYLRCSLLGSPVVTDNRLWYFVEYRKRTATESGWIPDHFLSTGQPGQSVTKACVGHLDDPREGVHVPNGSSGPFPVITDEGSNLEVRSSASGSARSVGSLRSGDLVVLHCKVTTTGTNPAPRALGPTASNGDWDRIILPKEGWIPDSNVNSQSSTSVAPAC